MFGNFEEEARKVLVLAKKEMFNLNHPYVSSEHLLLSILKINSEISDKLRDYDLDYDNFRNEIIKVIGKGSKSSEWFLYTPLLKRIIENATNDARENNGGVVTTMHLFVSLLEEGEGVAIRLLIGMGIDIDEIYADFNDNFKVKKGKKLLIDELGTDLNKKALDGLLDPVTGRDEEIKRVLEILSRRCKNNPLLIGPAGVGKTAIVEELANMIVSGNVPLSLNGKRIISLDMASAVAGTKYRGEFEERINQILKEIEENPDIILFIDEIHTLVGAGGAEGAIDASNIFKPALARGKIRCIGATTTEEYKKSLEKDKALSRRFQNVLIEAPSKKIVKDILMNLKEIYKDYHKVLIDDEIIDLIIDLSEKYMYDRRQPDKSIDILDEVCAKVSLKEGKNLKEYRKYKQDIKKIISLKKKAILDNDFELASNYRCKEADLMDKINNLELSLYKKNLKKVTKNDVALTVSEKTGIPVYELIKEKKKILKNVDNLFKKTIYGQEKAVKACSNIVKKIKLGFNDKCYSMLFCGPSGVGKTALAKVLGESIGNVIKVDMSEYKEAHSISKIIGAPAGYVGFEDTNNLLEEVRNKPFSVLILDEIEKAHKDVINLFLGALDEGMMKDCRGNIVRFDNVIIIMTSNSGFDRISVGFNKDNKESKLNDNFSIPFMNRVDKVIMFNELSLEDISNIIFDKLKVLKGKYKNKIKIEYDKDLVSKLASMINYKVYGARKVDKIIKDEVETLIIEALIDNKKNIKIKDIGQTV